MRKKSKSEKNNSKEKESKKKWKAAKECISALTNFYTVKKEETLWCLVDEDTFSSVFPIDIEPDKMIGHLKDSEFKENSIVLNNIEVKQKLIPTVKISSVFDNEILGLKIHFIVKVPANIEGYISPELESSNIISKCQKLLNEKDENVKEICKMPYPSTSTSPGKWKKCKKNPLKIYNLHLPECSRPPISLYHLVFSQFLLNYQNNELEIPPKRYTEVLDLCNVVEQIYQNEITDNTVFEEKAVPILWNTKTRYVQEEKILQFKGTEKIRNSSCYPSIILVIAEPWICVLGAVTAVYLEKPVIELLTDFILMMNHPEDNGKRVEELAVFFESLRLAFQTLDNYYKGLMRLKLKRYKVSSTSSSMESLWVAIDVGWIPLNNDVKNGQSACCQPRGGFWDNL
ncbi:hypothetical protein RhiirA4_475394 [Rhizophagus irregularis]|uniref:Crinkler effector protein N-terminal domain-containing protein n=1 Tax=Rhizophagus irregularis TaxID=588596 RepID=A0A2I1HA32_9GLOM|nr:hypothetical protein RhiirA4_475394 [Rhizophagus irregularis]